MTRRHYMTLPMALMSKEELKSLDPTKKTREERIRVTLRVVAPLNKAVEDHAKRDGITVNTLITAAIVDYLVKRTPGK